MSKWNRDPGDWAVAIVLIALFLAFALLTVWFGLAVSDAL
jgi:hypothetical protein